MKITIWNLKGGQGKTVLSLALAMQYDFYVVTNDVHSPIDQILEDGKALRVGNNESLPDVPEELNLIYDFGGYPDHRVIEAAKKSKFVIIPIIYGSALEMQVTINAISEIEEYTNNIIIIANKCSKGDFERVRETLSKFYQYPIFEIKSSTAFSKSIDKKMSLGELIKSNPLFGYHYKKPLQQLEEVMNFISKD